MNPTPPPPLKKKINKELSAIEIHNTCIIYAQTNRPTHAQYNYAQGQT